MKRADRGVNDEAPMSMAMAGNVYLDGAKPSKFDKNAIVKPETDPQVQIVDKDGAFELAVTLDSECLAAQARSLVTTELLGRAAIPDLPFEQPDGTVLRIDRDYLGWLRNAANPFPGPLECPEGGRQVVSLPSPH